MHIDGAPLAVERNFRRHRSFGDDAATRYAQRFQRVAHGIAHCRRFIAAVHHAIGAFLVIARAVGVPVGLVHELAERARVALAEQIARTLPAEHVARGIAPWRAAIALVAG